MSICIFSKLICRSRSSIKVKVIETKRSSQHNEIHTRVVCLRLNDNLVYILLRTKFKKKIFALFSELRKPNCTNFRIDTFQINCRDLKRWREAVQKSRQNRGLFDPLPKFTGLMDQIKFSLGTTIWLAGGAARSDVRNLYVKKRTAARPGPNNINRKSIQKIIWMSRKRPAAYYGNDVAW